jgi:hypothetical protein
MNYDGRVLSVGEDKSSSHQQGHGSHNFFFDVACCTDIFVVYGLGRLCRAGIDNPEHSLKVCHAF